MSKRKENIRTLGSVVFAVAFFFLLSKVFSFNMAVSGLLAVGMYFGAYFLLKPSGKIGKREVEEVKGGESSLALMEEAKRDIRSMEKNIDRIKDPTVIRYVTDLTQTGRKILVYLTEHPDRIADAHRFCDYYLDMAEKLTSTYIDMQKVVPDTSTFMDEYGGAGAYASEAASGKADFGAAALESSPERVMAQVKDALKVLNGAFEKQQRRLMQGDLMEVESEIQVLKDMIKMEGDS